MKILAVDYGDSRTGLAVCGKSEMLATPVGIITEKSIAKTVEAIAAAAREQQAQMVVVGLPVNMDGSEGPRAQKCRKVADLVQQALPDLPVRMWDERSSTKTAIYYMNETDTRGKKRKQTLDAAAAAIILESFLAWRRNHPEEKGE